VLKLYKEGCGEDPTIKGVNTAMDPGFESLQASRFSERSKTVELHMAVVLDGKMGLRMSVLRGLLEHG
jgi:hypothetical protein